MSADDKDPRRWITLGITTATVVIISLDTTVLNVAIPTMLRDFNTTLPSLQWVITGYALSFASLLIIGGRLGDLFGHRRIFVIGAALFGVGSLIAAISQSVPQLVVGEAIIEGVGAALMMPSSLAILSKTFTGHERAIAFGLWGAVGGASGALGPVVGGFLTSNFSWRWAFGINVIIVPFAIVGAFLFMPKLKQDGVRQRLDFFGAILIAFGMASLVFGLSEGERSGWLVPTRGFTVGGHDIWPASRPISLVLVAFVLAAGALTTFYKVSTIRERNNTSPLFEFSQLRRRGFRYGLITLAILSLGQMALAFVLPVFLQEGKGQSAQTNGLWQLPTGLFFLIGAQVGSRLSRQVPLVVMIQVGVVMSSFGLGYLALVISADIGFWTVFMASALCGMGAGLAVPQLTNVVLTDVDAAKAGAASGANNTARQMGISLGVAIIGALLSSRTIAAASDRITADSALSEPVRSEASRLIRSKGVSFDSPAGATTGEVAALRRIFVESLAAGARWPLLFGCLTGVLSLGASFLIPRVRHDHPNVAFVMQEDTLEVAHNMPLV